MHPCSSSYSEMYDNFLLILLKGTKHHLRLDVDTLT